MGHGDWRNARRISWRTLRPPRQPCADMAVLYVVSALGCALAWNWPALVVFRFIGGLGIGGSSVLGPMYIAEIAPAKWRGRLVGFFQFNVVFGILLAYFSNYLIGLAGLGPLEWRWELGITALPAVLFFVSALCHSPQPALAGGQGIYRRSPLCPAHERRSKLRTAAAEHRRLHPGGESLRLSEKTISPGSTACRFSWRSLSACSTSCPASTRFSTI